MAGELLAQIDPGALFRESSVGYDLRAQSALFGVQALTPGGAGQSRGLSIPKLLSGQLREYYNGSWIVPAAIALATGLTFRFQVSDDGTDPNDLGKVVQLEVTPFNLSTANAPMDYSLAASAGTVTTGNVTLSATSGVAVIASIAIVVANLKGLAAGNILGMRLRRVGDNAADTCNGRIILYGGVITNT